MAHCDLNENLATQFVNVPLRSDFYAPQMLSTLQSARGKSGLLWVKGGNSNKILG